MFTESGKKTLTAGEALAARRRVKLSGSTIVYAGAGENAIGVTEYAIANGQDGAVRMFNDAGTFEVTASGSISAAASIYGAAAGKVSATPSGPIIGSAIEASTNDGDRIEVILYSSPAVYVRMASVEIISAEILLLATTQIELIPAPGADKVIQVLSCSMILDYGTNVFTEPSAPDDLEVVYDTAGGESIADVVGDFVVLSADSIAQPQIKAVAGVAASGMVNKAVVLDNNGSNYGGNAGDDTTITVKLSYVIHDVGLA